MKIERLTSREVRAIHSMLLAWHGGAAGIRSENLLESALAQVPNVATGTGGTTHLLVTLAAAYATAIAKTRPFVDANRRTALVAAFTVIERNGFSVTASREDAFSAIYNLDLGTPSEAEFAAWLQSAIKHVPR